jgi:hypothetical protein
MPAKKTELERAGMSCCGCEMHKRGSAESDGNSVIVYECKACGHVDSQGLSSSRGWVGARARWFLALRETAFQNAGLKPTPAFAILDLDNMEVIFSTM